MALPGPRSSLSKCSTTAEPPDTTSYRRWALPPLSVLLSQSPARDLSWANAALSLPWDAADAPREAASINRAMAKASGLIDFLLSRESNLDCLFSLFEE